MADALEEVLVVYVTAPEPQAPDLARALVSRRVAACVNVVGPVRSVFRWEGALSEEQESLLIIKTTRAGFPALAEGVRELHPYQLPEILALPVVAGSPPYLSWVGQNVGAVP